MIDEHQLLIELDEEDPRNWKYCSKCGAELEKFIRDDNGKPHTSYYDKISGQSVYNVMIRCPNWDPKLQGSERHLFSVYESKRHEGIPLRKLPY